MSIGCVVGDFGCIVLSFEYVIGLIFNDPESYRGKIEQRVFFATNV